MTLLTSSSLADPPVGIDTPDYDRAALSVGIVHIGVGHFHRAHQAMFLDRLFNGGVDHDWAIWGVSMRPDAPVQSFAAQNHLYTLTAKHSDGRRSTRVLGSIIGFDSAADGTDNVMSRLADPATRIITLTVTEGGYGIDNATGQFRSTADAAISHDLENPGEARSWLGLIAAALRVRRDNNAGPITVLSCDNIQDNGAVTRDAVLSFVALTAPDLLPWIKSNVTFPSSMVDRVVPGTTTADRDYLERAFELQDHWAVTAEPFAQWVVEDQFAAGRPQLERVGVDVVDDVAPYERMKLRLANGVHQGLCFFGRLLDFDYVHEAVADPDIRAFLLRYVDEQAVPSLTPIPGVDLASWGRHVIDRFANEQLRDPLSRITADTSDRIPKFVLPVVADLIAAGHDVAVSAAIIAGWARYAQGIDEHGAMIEVQDPRRDEVLAAALADLDLPGAFLDLDVFAGLRDEPSFQNAFVAAREALNRHGARQTLRDLAAAHTGREGTKDAY